MARHLLMRLRAPLIAFGGEAIDNLGVIRDFPALSMVTGLLANALGWNGSQGDHHNRLQQRLRMGSRILCQGQRLTDFQTAELGANDVGWTTLGAAQGRAGGASTYEGPHLRYRDYHADLDVLVALRLEPADQWPRLEDLAAALDTPARPLFFGRKTCLPTHRIMAGWREADSILQALAAADGSPDDRVQWPDGEGRLPNDRLVMITDERNWTSGVHGGMRPVREGTLRAAAGQGGLL
ncbi:type I-E CRISPR-associated protein Cas5/CasD [Bordetella sp. 2513F-2]